MAASGAPLTPPPAPDLYGMAFNLLQDAKGLDDTGGQCWLEFSADGVSDWENVGTEAWEHLHNWGDWRTMDPGFYRALEVGNGVTYSGVSAPSEPWENV